MIVSTPNGVPAGEALETAVRPQASSGAPGAGACLHDGCVADPWLSDRLSRPSFRLVDPGPGVAGVLDRLPSDCFAWCRIADGDDVAATLRAVGFRLVDATIVFAGVPSWGDRRAPDDIRYEVATAADAEAVGALAARSLVHSRFHADPLVPDAVAAAIKADWARAGCRGARGAVTVVARTGCKPVGFLIALHGATDPGTMTIDLVAVDAPWRGRGIASALTANAMRRCPGSTRLVVGTQDGNRAASRAYEGMGLERASASHVYHGHRRAGRWGGGLTAGAGG